MITLFLKIYENHPDLCRELMEIFYRDCDNENRDRLNDLKKNSKKFTDIDICQEEKNKSICKNKME